MTTKPTRNGQPLHSPIMDGVEAGQRDRCGNLTPGHRCVIGTGEIACGARHDYLTCLLYPDHEGPHQACGVFSRKGYEWPRDIQPITPLKRELARVERCCTCGQPWESTANRREVKSTDPEYESAPIPGTTNVLIKLVTGRSFQLPGNPTHGEIVAACYAFAAGLCQGETKGLRKAKNILEGAQEELDWEIEEA